MGVSLNDGKALADEKKMIRKEVISIRNMLSPEQCQVKSRNILQAVYDTDIYKIADVILTYVDYQSEVITTPLIERALADGKKVFCPRVSGNEMDFYRIMGIDELKAGYRGIKEPVGGHEFWDFLCERDGVSDNSDAINDISNRNDINSRNDTNSIYNRTFVIIPGVAFDRNCHRMGYGKGFYDRYMTRLSEKCVDICKLGLGFECQLIEKVPCEAHDIVLDMLVTEENIYRRKK